MAPLHHVFDLQRRTELRPFNPEGGSSPQDPSDASEIADLFSGLTWLWVSLGILGLLLGCAIGGLCLSIQIERAYKRSLRQAGKGATGQKLAHTVGRSETTWKGCCGKCTIWYGPCKRESAVSEDGFSATPTSSYSRTESMELPIHTPKNVQDVNLPPYTNTSPIAKADTPKRGKLYELPKAVKFARPVKLSFSKSSPDRYAQTAHERSNEEVLARRKQVIARLYGKKAVQQTPLEEEIYDELQDVELGPTR